MIVFWILAFVLVASSVFVITTHKAVYSVVGLLLHFVALAIMFLTLSAEFLAVTQILVYSGAIVVLFLFVIALLSSGTRPFDVGPDRMPRAVWPGIGLIALALVLLVYGVARTPLATAAAPAVQTTAPLGPVGTAGVFGSVADFGAALFTTDLLPFEITALILMVAVIGVVVLTSDASPVKRKRRARREPIVKPAPRESVAKKGAAQ